MAPTLTKKKNVVFFHPDLGIGGAERLVIDAALGLQNQGHKVVIYTSYRDVKHCFDEAKDGTLEVRVRGNSIIPQSLFGRFAILCAILRQIHLILQICYSTKELRNLRPDVFFVDQLSAGIPLLRYFSPRTRVVFYCHFPDKLLAKRGSVIKEAYRIPFDWLESWTTGASDVIVVNSRFTKGIFGDAFPGLKHRQPGVVYPCVSSTAELKGISKEPIWPDKKVLLSINRFERKKDVGLAIKAFAGLPAEVRKQARLVIAGGHDKRVQENVSYHADLIELANSLKLSNVTATSESEVLSTSSDIDVVFILSVPSTFKDRLLCTSSMLLYTPSFEHFGIVPLEAMLVRTPVLAANTGGPTETVLDNETGWLRAVEDASNWTQVMHSVVSGEISTKKLASMGEKGRDWVVQNFSKSTMAQRLVQSMDEAQAMKEADRPAVWPPNMGLFIRVLGSLVGVAFAFLLFGKR